MMPSAERGKGSAASANGESSNPTKKGGTTRPHLTATSPQQSTSGHPVTIMTFDNNHRLLLDEKKLGEVLLRPEYKNNDVAILVVVGALRKGKSFLLDYILRYLKASGSSSWMGGEDEPLTGFSWRGGAERDTTGVLLWSRPFIIQLPNSITSKQNEVALFLMDTQGTFDSTQTFRDCTVLFALTTMVSSLLIYNLMHNIQQDDLLNLQFFTHYGRLVRTDESHSGPPFQDLIFLVRDWSYAYEKPYGYSGGDMLLKARMDAHKGHPEMKKVRKDLIETFQHVKCYLMPHPGLQVSTNPNYDGRLSAMEPDFRTYLKQFIESILNPKAVKRKMISNHNVKCFELFHYFKVYTEACQSTEMPEPLTLYAATAEANHLSATAAAKAGYISCMEHVVGMNRPYTPWPRLRVHHGRCVDTAFALFDDRRKMGSPDLTSRYRSDLVDYFHEEILTYEERNRSKRLFGIVRTPVVIFVLALTIYLLCAFSRLAEFHRVAKFLLTCGHIILFIFFVWIFSWSTGYFRRFRIFLDNTVDISLFKLFNL